MAKLTVKQIDGITEPGIYEDGDGLRLQVKESGKKYWLLRFQLSGQRRQMGLGSYPKVGLKKVRAEAVKQRDLIYQGVDPIANRKQRKEAQKAKILVEVASKVTFSELANDYILAHRPGWKKGKNAQQWQNSLTTYAFPIIGQLAPNQIETAHVLRVLQPIWSEKPETARRVRNRIELVLDSAKARGYKDGENPARWRGHLDKLLPNHSQKRKVKHHTALPWQDMPHFMNILTSRDDLSSLALFMTILTGCRTSEVLQATWSEVNLKDQVWTISAARMKAGAEHRVPIVLPLLRLLENLPHLNNSPYLFPGARENRPLSNMAMLMALRRLGREDLTVHGFRSTFRDWAGENTNHPREVCEQALAHSIGNAVENAYRRGDLFEKRRALMADWAAFILSKPSKKVVLFKQG